MLGPNSSASAWADATVFAAHKATTDSAVLPMTAESMSDSELGILRDVYVQLSRLARDNGNVAVRARAEVTIETLEREIDDRICEREEARRLQTRIPFVFGYAGAASPLNG